MSINLHELGPVDWIVVEFPETKQFTGEVAPILKDLVDRGLIRVLDLIFLAKDLDGGFEVFEAADLDDSEIGELRAYETALAMLLSEQDVIDLVETIEPGSSAAVLVWENLWAAPFGSAVRHSWPPAGAFRSRPSSRPSRQTPRKPNRKESDMPMAARRRRRTVAAVGGAAVVATASTAARTAAPTATTATTAVDEFLHAGTAVAEETMRPVAARLGLADLRGLSFIKLSNGQTRRARIARAARPPRSAGPRRAVRRPGRGRPARGPRTAPGSARRRNPIGAHHIPGDRPGLGDQRARVDGRPCHLQRAAGRVPTADGPRNRPGCSRCDMPHG